jgi:hypothetical protein
MNTKTVVEQSQLRGANNDAFLQKVATVYLDGDEYRVLAPPKAVGEALDWIEHFSVRQPNKESFHSEILVEGAFRILAIKLVREELEKMKTAARISSRERNRKSRLRELLDDFSRFRMCGPGDDPDEQTNVIESYRYMLINIKALSRGVLSSDVCEQLELVPSDIESVYNVYESKAHLDAVCIDIDAELSDPTTPSSTAPRTSLVASKLIEDLSKVKSDQFDVTKLTGYCKEINSSFYHGNVVGCLLLMRTVLNHVPPVFGHRNFGEVTANAGKSIKDNLEHLESGLRKLADLYAHQPIRKKEQYPTKSQVEPFRPQFEVLLHEVLGRLQPATPSIDS